VSADAFNRGPRGLVMAMPLTRRLRAYPYHVEILPAESGLPHASYIMCEQLRSISKRRLLGDASISHASPATLTLVEDRLRTLLELSFQP
jgi:mRNA interferase MazF